VPIIRPFKCRLQKTLLSFRLRFLDNFVPKLLLENDVIRLFSIFVELQVLVQIERVPDELTQSLVLREREVISAGNFIKLLPVQVLYVYIEGSNFIYLEELVIQVLQVIIPSLSFLLI